MTDVSLALYRKYRPATFAEVRNQDHIVNVLQGAIKKKAIPHALLFTGPRGTGKTTVARIFAREIGTSDVDTYEIDAASNRTIDDVRELKEAVHTLPYESPYKVYIIDEVHMLTKEAFNALLKTLEEPPHHVVFILATTERDKLLDTITSRCQVFEFHAPTQDELRETVLAVVKHEKFKLGAQAADTIALAADGSYRDALGITQKVMMASGDSDLTEDEVAQIVGAPRSVIIRSLVISLGEKDTQKGLDALKMARTAHVDVKLLGKLLLEYLRSIIVLRYNPSEVERLSLKYGNEDIELIKQYALKKDSPINSRLLLNALDRVGYLGRTTVPELPLELFIVEEAGA